MHSCWLIPELSTQIIEEYARQHAWVPKRLGNYRDQRGLRTLSMLARTCRALHDPALNALWYQMHSLSYLFKLLPQELWVRHTRTHLGSELRLTHARRFVAADWERFDYYARRIRVFVALDGVDDSPPYRAQDLLDVLRAAKDVPLLPNLQSVFLKVYLEVPMDAINFVLCVAPLTLTEISIYLTREMAGPHLSERLRALAASCPAIQRVNLEFDAQFIDLDLLASVVPSWNALRAFTLHELLLSDQPGSIPVKGHALLCALNALPHLTVLRLRPSIIRNHLIRHAEGHAIQPLAFQPLRRLVIHAHDTVVWEILRDMSPSHLEALEVKTGDLNLFSSISQYLDSHSFTHALQKLVLQVNLPMYLDLHTVVTGRDLKPLMHLHGLQHLALRISTHWMLWTIEVDDDEWEVFARSWPRLRSLTVMDGTLNECSRPGHTIDTSTSLAKRRPTLQSLVHLARHCPELASVTMTLVDTNASMGDVDLPVRPDLTCLWLRINAARGHHFHSLSGASKSEDHYGQYTWEEVKAFIREHRNMASDPSRPDGGQR